MELTHASFFSGVGGPDLGLERAVANRQLQRDRPLRQRRPRRAMARRFLNLATSPLSPTLRGSRTIRTRRTGDTMPRIWTGEPPPSGQPDSRARLTLRRRQAARLRPRLRGRSCRYSLRPCLRLPWACGAMAHPPPSSLETSRDFNPVMPVATLGTPSCAGRTRVRVGYLVLDAQHFGVPQRRRRVFILGLDTRRVSSADDAAEVLSVGSRCGRHRRRASKRGRELPPEIPQALSSLAKGTASATTTPTITSSRDTAAPPTGRLLPWTLGARPWGITATRWARRSADGGSTSNW